jgi:L-ascorbate metabolism protein UlaG (beta-lactamase superfamily)
MTPPASDHFNGKTFFQPGAQPQRTFRDFLRWQLTGHWTSWPKSVALPPVAPLPMPRGGEIAATWLGHASFLLRTSSATVLLDPVLSARASPFRWIGPRRVHPAPFTVETLPLPDVVCLSHDHYDHFDGETLRQLARRGDALFVAPLRHRDLLERIGAKRLVELDWWQTHRVSSQFAITLTPAKHWSKRLGTPRNHRLWGGFWLTVTSSPGVERHVWFVGDSGYDEPLFREIRARCGVPDLAMVPIGAYEPRWFMAPMHMNPEETVRLHRDAGAKLSVAMHWGTFRLTEEGRDAPAEALAHARERHGIAADTFRVLQPGESIVA